MDPAKKIGNRLGFKLRAALTRLGFGDKTLKIIFLLGIVLFGAGLFLFKFEILSSLSLDETARLDSVTSLKTFAQNPTDPIQGTLQWLSLKTLPNHHIFALRMPTAYLLGATLALCGITLYLKFRNRYLPYTFAVLAASSPWMILLSHQGYVPGIDVLALVASITCAYFLITKSDINVKWKKLALMKATAATGLLAIQPFGPFSFTLMIVLGLRSKTLRQFISSLSKGQKLVIFSPLLIFPLINVAFLYANIENWRLISGWVLLQDPAHIAKALLYNVRSIFDIEQTQGLSLGTGRPDFLLMGALALTLYEVFKKRVGRKGLVIGLAISLLISALYGAPTSIVFAIPFTIAILSLALANMIRIIDAAFPRNPYPRNIARTGMLILICLLATLNIYTFISATARENTPNDIDTITISRVQ